MAEEEEAATPASTLPSHQDVLNVVLRIETFFDQVCVANDLLEAVLERVVAVESDPYLVLQSHLFADSTEDTELSLSLFSSL